jgi:5-carboxyvanillate decarboxylase
LEFNGLTNQSMINNQRTRVIAVEEHFVADAYFEETAQLFVAPGEEPERYFMNNIAKNPELRRRFTSLETRLAEMDSSGTDLAVLSLNPPGVQIYADTGQAVSLACKMNDRLVEIIKAQPTRFHGLGSVAPQDPEQAAREIKRIMGPLGLGGVMIASHTHGRYLDEPECEPILSALEEENATLYLHPRSPSPQMLGPYKDYGMIAALWGFQAEGGTHAVRLIMSGALDRHPNLKIVLGHLGEGLPFWMWRLDNIYKRTYGLAAEALGMVKLELRPSEYLQRNFAVTTSGMADSDVLDYCVGKLGAENILFAIDYPYEDSKTAVEFLATTPLDDRQRALVSHENAQRLFRVPSVS